MLDVGLLLTNLFVVMITNTIQFESKNEFDHFCWDFDLVEPFSLQPYSFNNGLWFHSVNEKVINYLIEKYLLICVSYAW